MASLRFTNKRAQAVYNALMSARDATEFGERLEDALKVLDQSEPPEQIRDKRFGRGKVEFRNSE